MDTTNVSYLPLKNSQYVIRASKTINQTHVILVSLCNNTEREIDFKTLEEPDELKGKSPFYQDKLYT